MNVKSVQIMAQSDLNNSFATRDLNQDMVYDTLEPASFAGGHKVDTTQM